MRCGGQSGSAVCKQNIEAVRYSVQSEEDYLECPVPQPAERSEDERDEERGSAEPQLEAPERGFPAEVWADFFRGDPGDLEPLLRWLQRELEDITGDEWWEWLRRGLPSWTCCARTGSTRMP